MRLQAAQAALERRLQTLRPRARGRARGRRSRRAAQRAGRCRERAPVPARRRLRAHPRPARQSLLRLVQPAHEGRDAFGRKTFLGQFRGERPPANPLEHRIAVGRVADPGPAARCASGEKPRFRNRKERPQHARAPSITVAALMPLSPPGPSHGRAASGRSPPDRRACGGHDARGACLSRMPRKQPVARSSRSLLQPGLGLGAGPEQNGAVQAETLGAPTDGSGLRRRSRSQAMVDDGHDGRGRPWRKAQLAARPISAVESGPPDTASRLGRSEGSKARSASASASSRALTPCSRPRSVHHPSQRARRCSRVTPLRTVSDAEG